MKKLDIGTRAACKYCGQDIEWHGKESGWIDRGGNRACVPYIDKRRGEVINPKTKHAKS